MQWYILDRGKDEMKKNLIESTKYSKNANVFDAVEFGNKSQKLYTGKYKKT